MTPEEKTIETAIHCLGVRAEQEVCEERPAYLEGGIACREVARAAISALEELQQYREIGTVEELKQLKEILPYLKSCRQSLDNVVKRCNEYEQIGTVEECREAVEKQKAKKPKDSLEIKPVIDRNGAYVDADMTVYLLCPNCGEMVGIYDNCDNYCRECGQAIDTENLGETEDE